MREQRIWRHAHAPAGILLNHLDEKAVVLASRLQEFFRIREGSGRFCRIHAYPQHEGACFAAVLADRVQQFNTFTETGEYTTQWLRPTFSVCFVYYADGSLLLKSRLRASDRLLELLRCFGKAVLGVELPEGCLRDSFHLDRLTHEFQPLPDAEDMELIRIRSIQFGYPQRKGRPQVKVKTLSSDGHAAIEPLLRTHLPRGGMLDPLHVSYAELQIRLRIEGQSRNYLIRLWPNASNLNPTPLGERLRACLKRWGLLHV